MADGNLIVHGRVIGGTEAGLMSLEQADSAGHVVSRCPRCGHRESTDASYWRRSAGDRQASLGTLSKRLRCICGNRDVTLEVWPISPTLNEDRLRIFHWRA